jgi:hypothetical protein
MLSAKLKEAAGNSADATLYVNDVFSTWLYTGNGSTQTITNGIDLAGKGGMVWIKARTVAADNVLTDTARGVTNGAIKSNTAAQAQGTTTYITSFNSTGYNLAYYDGIANASADAYTSWTFRKAAKFFDVVTYTGTGSARTIAHSLGVAPGMVVVKRTDASANWQVYHRSLTSAAYSTQLNLTNAEASAPTVWNSTAPTNSVFSVGTDATVNASGGTYVAYLYAHDTSSTGIIQCGSYVGNGLTAGPNITLGWEPQYVLRKNASNARGGPDGNGSWDICDSMRGMSQTSCPFLLANSAAVEDTSTVTTGFIIPNATGFVDTYTYPGDTYIYMAIRSPNKPPTTGTQVFSPNLSSAATGTPITTGFPIDAQISKVNTGGLGNMYDRLRGITSTTTQTGQFVSTSSSAQEFTSTGEVRAWDNTGFQLSSGLSGIPVTYWNFKRAPGFFDEVCYTGTGVATTQAHNLTVVPELMIVKERSAANDWWVYDAIDGNTKYSVLNSTAIPVTSSTAWNNTTPTASVFSIGTGANVNASAQTFVAYLFATLAGISKVGSYTGNGTGQAIACGFGSGGARFVLIKRTDASGSWYTFDSARGLTSVSSPYLLLNNTAAEVTGNNGVYASSGGFTFGSTASTTTNISGASYIFLAVA